MEEIKKLNDDEMEQAAGGKLNHCPSNVKLEELGLSDIVICTNGISDTYYDTKRDNGVWKNVGSEDMLRYVERKLGTDDKRYRELYAFCNGDEWSPD